MSSTPTIVGQGTGATGVGGTPFTIAYPADVSVSDFSIIALYIHSAATGTVVPGTNFAWTQLNGVTLTHQNEKMLVYYRVCDGSEDSANITVNSTGGGSRSAQVYVFRGDPGATWKFDINGASISPYINRTISATLSAPIVPISTSGANRLIINIHGSGYGVTGTLSFSAVTGAVYTGALLYASSPNSLQLHWASVTSSGSISGGAATPSVAAGYTILGTAIAASLASTPPITLVATGLASGVGFGGSPIITPVGFAPHYATELWPWCNQKQPPPPSHVW